MLVLERGKREGLMIGDNIEVVVLGITSRGHVKLGIQAPRGTSILRTELVARSRHDDAQSLSPRD